MSTGYWLDGHIVCLTVLVNSAEMTCKTSQHFQNPKTLRPLGRCWWNLARIFYGSGTQL